MHFTTQVLLTYNPTEKKKVSGRIIQQFHPPQPTTHNTTRNDIAYRCRQWRRVETHTNAPKKMQHQLDQANQPTLSPRKKRGEKRKKRETPVICRVENAAGEEEKTQKTAEKEKTPKKLHPYPPNPTQPQNPNPSPTIPRNI